MSAPVIELWPEVDRVALCIHRPSGQDTGFRELVTRLRIPAGSILVSAARYLAAGRVKLRYLRADLHAHALSEEGLVGPRARALARAWKGHPLSDRDAELLRERGLADEDSSGWRVTEAARTARDRAERVTDELAARVFAAVSEAAIARLLALLRMLPGEDPRPAEDR